MLKLLLSFLTAGPLDRLLSSLDRKMDAGTAREKARGEVVSEYLRAQAALLGGRGWWFPLFFVAPLGLWFAAVCVYSILFCAGCAFPQTWSVAALPAPLDQWAGAVISSLFVGKAGEAIVARWRK